MKQIDEKTIAGILIDRKWYRKLQCKIVTVKRGSDGRPMGHQSWTNKRISAIWLVETIHNTGQRQEEPKMALEKKHSVA